MSRRVLARILTGVLLLFQSGPTLVWADLKESGCPENYKDLNINAQLTFGQYDTLLGIPNSRPLKGSQSYETFLDDVIEERVPFGGVHIDVGGGRGTAAREISRLRNSTAIVINSQQADDETIEALLEMKGKFRYVEGWAEEQLPKFKNTADLVTDVYGAYSYSIKKPEILQAIYASLKPGGMARIYAPPNSKAWVKVLKRGQPPKILSLPNWLAATYPEIFSVVKLGPRPPNMTQFQMPSVIVIRKPFEAKELNLNLQYLQHTEEGREGIRRGTLSPKAGPPTPFDRLKQIAPETLFLAR